MQIRGATIDDLNRIAATHTECFPGSFSTALGTSLLRKFYLQYLKNLFLVAANGDSIVGFCMGYLCDRGNCNRYFIKRNFIHIGFRYISLLIEGNKRAWERLKLSRRSQASNIQVLNSSLQNTPSSECGDLLSICVLPEYRGSETANELMCNYQKALKKVGRSVCFLTVAVENSRAIRFYEKNGFVPSRALGNIAITYAKRL